MEENRNKGSDKVTKRKHNSTFGRRPFDSSYSDTGISFNHRRTVSRGRAGTARGSCRGRAGVAGTRVRSGFSSDSIVASRGVGRSGWRAFNRRCTLRLRVQTRYFSKLQLVKKLKGAFYIWIIASRVYYCSIGLKSVWHWILLFFWM